MIKRPSHCLMVQGCTSDAGKTTLVAGLCRLLQRRGLSVAPFKPQNMALNSAVTEDGGEIGRAQALQAMAAKVPLSVHMNPVLLKPSSDTGAQVILQGHSIGNINAMDYHFYKPKAAKAVFESFAILSKTYPIIVVEGAGSPAEINLRQGDIANMGFAEEVDCPVILIADIDKGGVFAHIVGTLSCLSESEQARIQGFVINRFRGDIKLLEDGLEWLEQQTGKPVLGVLPYLHGLHLDAEDAISPTKVTRPGQFKVICPLLPHISNHTDLDPLLLHPDIDFEFIRHNEPLPPADLVILPGSKSVAFDLQWLKEQGWQTYLNKHLRYEGKIIGICGGLQMLGQWILDPQGIESAQPKQAGFGLFDYSTTLQAEKQLINRIGSFNFENPALMKGYEIHQGVTDLSAYKPAIIFDTIDDNMGATIDGAFSADNQILVSYCHGLFDETSALQSLLQWANVTLTLAFDLAEHREEQINRLADTLEQHLDLEKINQILGF